MGEDHYKLYEDPKTKWDLFKQYILPWLIFVSIGFAIYYILLYGLQAVFILSEPLSKGMKEIGL